jgi:hypothetical protein
MIETGGGSRFFQKALDGNGIVLAGFSQHLKGDRHIAALVQGTIDASRSTGTEM